MDCKEEAWAKVAPVLAELEAKEREPDRRGAERRNLLEVEMACVVDTCCCCHRYFILYLLFNGCPMLSVTACLVFEGPLNVWHCSYRCRSSFFFSRIFTITATPVVVSVYFSSCFSNVGIIPLACGHGDCCSIPNRFFFCSGGTLKTCHLF